jgi:hypothetical protein
MTVGGEGGVILLFCRGKGGEDGCFCLSWGIGGDPWLLFTALEKG